MRRSAALLLTILASSLCAGCQDWQSALATHGPQAASIKNLLVVFVAICGAIWALVIIVLAGSVVRRRDVLVPPIDPDPRSDRRAGTIVWTCVGATVLVIGILTLASYLATRGLAGPGADALTIRLRGYQWWWEVTYLDSRPDHVVTLANEIHVPVGRSLHIQLDAPDVIHSFWVPSLAGKLDLIPGRQNEITIRADRPGAYRGQCAEFCGLQHAHMAFLVIAETAEEFDAWQARQLSPAAAPPDDEIREGQRVFLNKPCAACHTVRGTPAAGTLGPDLTHVASRRYIASGLLPTTRGSLAAWIADPQTIKPGNNMPMVSLTADELRAVSAYMASLQ